MLKLVKSVICLDCKETQEVVWSVFGAEYPCVYCDSAPVNLVSK